LALTRPPTPGRDRPKRAIPDRTRRHRRSDDRCTAPQPVLRRTSKPYTFSNAEDERCYYYYYYAAGRWLTGHVLQVRCVNGVVQLILDSELVRAWRQRHTPEREQRMLQRPTPGSAPPTPSHRHAVTEQIR